MGGSQFDPFDAVCWGRRGQLSLRRLKSTVKFIKQIIEPLERGVAVFAVGMFSEKLEEAGCEEVPWVALFEKVNEVVVGVLEEIFVRGAAFIETERFRSENSGEGRSVSVG